MADAPEAGWYSDPAGKKILRYWDGKVWTDQTRPTEPDDPGFPRRRMPAIAIVGIVVAALLAIGGFAAIILNAGNGSDDPGVTASTPPTPTPEATDVEPTERTAPEVGLPEGWELYVSRSGAFEYAYDPAWTDAWTPSFERMLLGTIDLEDLEMEVAGSWLLDGSMVTGGTNLIIIATSDGTTIPALMELQAESFVRSNATGVGSEDFEKVLSEGMTTANGYDAWRIDYTMTASEIPLTASVVAFRHETTLGFIYVASLADFEAWVPGFLALVDSLVVIRAPASP